MAQRSNGPPNPRAHRVVASLNRDQVDYLDRLGKDAQFSSGVKLSRTELLAAMVNALRRLNLTGEGVTTAKQFEQRILDAMTRKTQGGTGSREAPPPRASSTEDRGPMR